MPHRRAGRRRRGHVVGPEPDRACERGGVGHAHEEGVAALVDVVDTAERRRRDLAAERRACLPHLDLDVGVLDEGDGRGEAGDTAADDEHPARHAAIHPARTASVCTRCGERSDHGRVVVDACGAVEREAVRDGAVSGLDVEVVQHLEVVGHEPDGRHDDALDRIGAGGEGVDRPRGCRGRATARGCARRSASRSASRCPRRGRVGRPPPRPWRAAGRGTGRRDSMIRDGSEWAVNTTRVFAGIAARRARRSADEEVDERRLDRPRLDAGGGDAVRLGRGAHAPEVLADRIGGVVRCEHDAGDPRRPRVPRARRRPPRSSGRRA